MIDLKEKSRVIAVSATAQDENNLYEVNYKTTADGKKLQECAVNIKGLNNNIYKGYMNLNADGQISTNFNDASIDTVAMMTLFNGIVTEIKSDLSI